MFTILGLAAVVAAPFLLLRAMENQAEEDRQAKKRQREEKERREREEREEREREDTNMFTKPASLMPYFPVRDYLQELRDEQEKEREERWRNLPYDPTFNLSNFTPSFQPWVKTPEVARIEADVDIHRSDNDMFTDAVKAATMANLRAMELDPGRDEYETTVFEGCTYTEGFLFPKTYFGDRPFARVKTTKRGGR